MSQALRLTDSSTKISDTLYFERRRDPRRRARGQVTAVIRPTNAQHHAPAKMLVVDLLDISDSGIGLTSQEPVDTGNRVTVFFPPHGAEPGFDLAGEIVRCKTHDNQHTLGVALEETQTRHAG